MEFGLVEFPQKKYVQNDVYYENVRKLAPPPDSEPALDEILLAHSPVGAIDGVRARKV